MPRPELKLNQVIALLKGVKAGAEGEFTRAYHDAQKPALFAGVTKTYKTRDEDGEKLPPEGTLVQMRATDVITRAQDALTRLMDVQLTMDGGNQVARADLLVDDTTIATGVPVTFLLVLEKRLTDLHTFVSKLPVLDPAEQWTLDTTDGYYKAASMTTRSKKVPRNHVKAEATDKHPAQVEVYYEDTIVGDWTTTKLSAALPATRVAQLLTRVTALQEAVKVAREAANSTAAPDREIGAKVFDYLLAG